MKFARVTPDLVIPTGYRADQVPGWSVDASNQFAGNAEDGHVQVPLDGVAVQAGESVKVGDKTVLKSTSDQFSITFPITQCKSSAAVGLEVSGSRSYPGWIQVLGGRDNNFDHRNSVLRYYPQGEFREKFAFSRDDSQNTILFKPGFSPGEAEIREIKMYCLM